MRKNKEHLWLYSILLSLIFAMGFLIISLLLASNIKIAEAFENFFDVIIMHKNNLAGMLKYSLKKIVIIVPLLTIIFRFLFHLKLEN